MNSINFLLMCILIYKVYNCYSAYGFKFNKQSKYSNVAKYDPNDCESESEEESSMGSDITQSDEDSQNSQDSAYSAAASTATSVSTFGANVSTAANDDYSRVHTPSQTDADDEESYISEEESKDEDTSFIKKYQPMPKVERNTKELDEALETEADSTDSPLFMSISTQKKLQAEEEKNKSTEPNTETNSLSKAMSREKNVQVLRTFYTESQSYTIANNWLNSIKRIWNILKFDFFSIGLCLSIIVERLITYFSYNSASSRVPIPQQVEEKLDLVIPTPTIGIFLYASVTVIILLSLIAQFLNNYRNSIYEEKYKYKKVLSWDSFPVLDEPSVSQANVLSFFIYLVNGLSLGMLVRLVNAGYKLFLLSNISNENNFSSNIVEYIKRYGYSLEFSRLNLMTILQLCGIVILVAWLFGLFAYIIKGRKKARMARDSELALAHFKRRLKKADSKKCALKDLM